MLRGGYFLSIVFLIVCSINLFSQRDELRTTFLEAESWFLFEEYPDALLLYQQILEDDPGNDNLNYKIGICYMNDPYQMDRSISYLRDASDNINPAYKENSFKERTAPPEALYYLANAYLVNNKIDSAIYYYRRFSNILDEDIYDKELVLAQIECCETAIDIMKKPVDFDVYNLDSMINTRYAEVNPVISGDGNSMVLVYKGPFQDAPLYSTKTDGQWNYPRNLNLELGVDGDVYPTALSYDGTEMIIYRSDDYIGNLYSSRLVEGRWTPLVKLNDHINTKYWESHACLSRDGKTLYFTSNRKGGFGGLDIYESRLQSSGEWGPARNLGEKINTRYNEDTPFITMNGQLLYFSSYGHFNMGGYDIFYAKSENDTLWGHPINLGYPINTTYDDRFFQPVDDGFGAYYAMYRPEGLGRHDIYYMDIYSENNPRMYMVSGFINVEEGLADTDDVLIYLIDPTTGDTITYTYPDRVRGEFSFELPQGMYNLVITGDKYQEVIRPLHIGPLSNKEGIRLDKDINLKLIPYEPKVFEGDESDIGIKDSIYEAKAGEPVTIPLQLEKGSTLITTVIVDSSLVSSDTMLIKKRRTKLEIVPQPGRNIVELQMINENGDIHKRTIIIDAEAPQPVEEVHLPAEVETPASDTSYADNMTEKIAELSGATTGGLAAAIIGIDPSEEDINSDEKLFRHLYENADEGDYTRAEVDLLLAKEVAGDDVQKLHQLMIENSEGELKEFLESFDPEELGISDTESYLKYLEENAEAQGYSAEDISNALLNSLNKQTELEEIVSDYSNNVSDDKLRETLQDLDLEANGIYTVGELVEYLYDHSETYGYDKQEVDKLLAEIISNGDVNRLYQLMLENSDGALKEFLESLDPEDLNFTNAEEFLLFLRNNAEVHGYTEEDIRNVLRQCAEKQTDAEILHKQLLKKAEGDLNTILENLDTANEGIYTTEDLIKYLIQELLAAGYSEKEIEELLTDLLGTEFSSQIQEYLKDQAGGSIGWIIGIAAGLMLLILIIFWRRRKKE